MKKTMFRGVGSAVERKLVRMMCAKWASVASCALLSSLLLGPAVAADQSATTSKVLALQHTLAAQPEAAAGQAVTQLADGRWLMSGGKGTAKMLTLIDPATGKAMTLPYALQSPRSGHSATLLPDGTVLIYGGSDESGSALKSGEVIDLRLGTTKALGPLGLLARTGHSATLLADGTVLLVGGRDARGVGVSDAELFDPLTNTVSRINMRLDPLRWDQVAALLPTSGVLLVGGKNGTGANIRAAQTLDPVAQTLSVIDDASTSALIDSITGTVAPAVIATTPSAASTDFPVNGRLVVRLSKRMNVGTLSAQTVTLVGPNGPVTATVVGAERGLLLFVTPKQDLLPATHYSLFVKGATDELGQPLPLVSVGFSTGSISAASGRAKAGAPGVAIGGNPVSDTTTTGQFTTASTAAVATQAQGASETTVADAELGAEEWAPEKRHQHGNWRTGRHKSRFQSLPPLQAHAGVTALAGQVLKLNGKPLADVELRAGGKTTRSDASGRFLLENVPAGPVVLEIDGATADGRASYGYYSDRVIAKAGETTPLGYPIWMTRLDTKHVVSIASPTTQETVVSNPAIPGLELHLPAGTVIKDRQGKIVTQLSITAIPVDRPPFPLPVGVNVPTYFTVQPGGATIENLNSRTPVGARLIYPNFTRQPPGSTVLFWDYDPQGKGWYVYGKGKVSVDGTQSIPDPGVAIYQLTGAMVGSPNEGPPNNPPPCDGDCEGPTPPPDPDSGNPDSGNENPDNPDQNNPDQNNPDPGNPDPGTPDPGNPDSGTQSNNGSGSGGSSCTGGTAGDPVDCATGIFMYHHRDLVIKDKVSIGITRTYLSRDGAQRAFGIGTAHDYDMFLVGDTSPWTYQDLILPRGGKIHFTRTSSGTGFANAVYVAQATPNSRFQGATLTWDTPAGDWKLRTKDGSVYEFPEAMNNTIPSLSGMLSFADKNGNKVTIERNAINNNVSRVVSPNGRFISFSYDTNARVTQVSDISGRVVKYQYDDLGRLATVTDPNGGIERYTYDDNNNMLSVTDARGNLKVQNTYEPTYQAVATQTLANGGVYRFTYGFSSAPATANSFPKHLTTDVTDPAGVLSRRTFDTNSNATTSVSGMDGDYVIRFDQAVGTPLQWSRIAARDSAGRLTSFTDELGRVTTKAYDTFGNVTSQTVLSGTPQAATTTYSYDGKNRLVSKTDALGHTTTYAYDAAGNLISKTDPLGHTWSRTYDSQGNLLSQKDPLGNIRTYAYSNGLLSQITDEIGSVTRLSRDVIGRLLVNSDPLGNGTSYDYDSLDRVTSITDPTGHALLIKHDANGNVITITTPAGLLYKKSYDSGNRLIQEIDAAGKSSSLAYDVMDRLITLVDRNGQTTTRAYNVLGQLVSRQFADGLLEVYSYDLGGRLLSTTRGADTISFNFDGLNNVTREQGPAGGVSSTYDLMGKRVLLAVDGQPPVTYSYDNAGRLTAFVQAAGPSNGSITQTVTYTWDNANRLTGRTLPNGIVERRVMNASADITNLSFTHSSGDIGTIAYAYDNAHRRITQSGTLGAPTLPAVAAFQYNAAGRLSVANGNAISYDDNGAVVADNTYRYIWDSRGHLAQLTTLSGQSVASFAYDIFGRRSSIRLPTDSSPRGFVYDGADIVQEISAGTSISSVATFLNGPILDQVVARYTPIAVETMIQDAVGSVIELTNPMGVATTQYTYDPFGVTNTTGNLSTNARQYTARENDGTGLYYYRARYYNPSLGRFISEDPIGFASGQISRYAYVDSNPINRRDPSGLAGCDGPTCGGGCSQGGSYGYSGRYKIFDNTMCEFCARKEMGVENNASSKQVQEILGPYELGGSGFKKRR